MWRPWKLRPTSLEGRSFHCSLFNLSKRRGNLIMKWNLVSMYLFYSFQNLRVNCNFLPKYGSFEATRAGVYAFTYAFLTEKSEAAMWVNTRTPLNFSPIPIPKDHFTILEPEDQEIGEFFMQFMNVVRQILKLLSCVSREILISCNRQANQDRSQSSATGGWIKDGSKLQIIKQRFLLEN